MTAQSTINELNDAHITEAVDRLHVTCTYIDEFLGQHALLNEVPEFINEINKASDILSNLYEEIANLESINELVVKHKLNKVRK